jgi:hypothetical protein
MFGTADPKVWLHFADNSYLSSRLLFFTGFTLEAPVSAHRTLELYLKAFLVAKGVDVKPGSPAWGHRLSSLGASTTAPSTGVSSGLASTRIFRPLMSLLPSFVPEFLFRRRYGARAPSASSCLNPSRSLSSTGRSLTQMITSNSLHAKRPEHQN